MKFTTKSRTWKQLCLLFAFLLTTAHGNNNFSCFLSGCTYKQIDKQLQDMKNCLETISITWTAYQNANIFNHLHTLTDIIQKQQNEEFRKSLPAKCPVPAVLEDGGLLCISATNKTYCKPMCNAANDIRKHCKCGYCDRLYFASVQVPLQQTEPTDSSAPPSGQPKILTTSLTTDPCHTYRGYDFSFIRRSRLFEECSSATQDKWTTQFIGGNRLAICDKSNIAVSGAPSAYFPEGQDCWKTKSDEQLMGNITKIFQSELVTAGITQSLDSSSLLCGQNKN